MQLPTKIMLPLAMCIVTHPLWADGGESPPKNSSNVANTPNQAILADPGDGKSQADDRRLIQSPMPNAVIAYLTNTEVSGELRNAMMEVVQQHPTESSWSGRNGNQLFAIAAQRLPKSSIRQRAVPAMLRLTHAVAISSLLKTKAALDAYKAEGLTDISALRTAVDRVTERLDVIGSVQGMIDQTAVQDDFAVGYVIADEEKVTARLRQPAILNEVKSAYQNVIHEQMRKLMEQQQWEQSLGNWNHLQELNLTSESLFVDAVRCLMSLDRIAEATLEVGEFLKKHQLTTEPETLEQLGDLLLPVDSPAAQDTATAAYRAASERLRNLRSRR